MEHTMIERRSGKDRRVATTTRQYDVILADPCWSYGTWAGKASRTADAHYPTMTVKEICDLNVHKLAADNCALFLWATPPTIEDAFKVIPAWGFRYKTFAFTWVKTNPKSGTIATGMGHYTRANAEVCLLGIKGRMPVAVRNINQIILSPRRKHSQKPHEAYDKIQQLYPTASKIELFARNTMDGWDSLGNELGFDLRDL